MRWPLMFTYDHLLTLAKEAQTHAEQMLEELQQRNQDYRDLLDKYHALKVQGAAIPEAPKPAVPVDPVSAAITQAARHDPRLRALMAKEASRMREAQFTDHEIIDAIQNGVTSFDGLPA